MTERYDAIVIGAGHNGLVCAAYLAKAGRKALVLEAGSQVGGAAVTRAFAPGYKVSAGAHLLHLMSDALSKDLDLARHGLKLLASNLPTVALAADGAHAVLGPKGTLKGASADDQAAFAAFTARLDKFARVLAPVLGAPPPRLALDNWADRAALAKLGWNVRTLGTRDMREFLRIVGMNVYDLVEEQFDSDLLKGAFGFDAVLGTAFGPRSPGTVLTLLYRLAGAVGGPGLALPEGGMGSVTAALASAAKAAGAEIRTGARVARILVENDRASGVALESGETIQAATVVSNADPKATFLKLLGPEYLDTGFVRRVDKLRARGMAAKLHLGLSGLPDFPGLEKSLLGSRMLIAPSLNYVERAYNFSKYEAASEAPAIELTLPSVYDKSLAPSGGHVLSAIVQYAPYRLKDGWDAIARERFADRAVDALETVAPGIGKLIAARELLAPPDIEREFGMTGGHWHHGELAFDQFYMVRPVPGAAQHETPLDGLFLCGAGCHPGGGVMGLAGRNAARQMLKKVA
jgi:phytoene dehydrogenase-like protein